MLYTVMPTEIIFQNQEKSKDEQQYDYEEVSLKNCTLQLHRGNNGYTVKRIISTDPNAYLDETLEPGTILSELKLSQLKETK
ncbi:MAG: YlzJ-like family protein [Eubacteriales bacterium]